jgi:16S rRNA (cytosine1402-N4)-methyltransferase
MVHQTVLLNEAIESLNLKPGSIFFDGTLGGGGHSAKVCQDFGHQVKIIATDRDSAAIARTSARIKDIKCDFNPVLSDYRQIKKILTERGITEIDAMLLDLGLSSNQLEESGRGFTFQKDEPLLMTFAEEKDQPAVTAMEVVNDWQEETLADIIYGFADERYAKRIAREIVAERQNKKIKTTGELVEIIRRAVPAVYRHGKTHFATKTFQAIRVAVNDELGALHQGLQDGFESLKIGGRLSVISFHSSEDRLVKNYFRELKDAGMGKNIFKKPLTPTPEELSVNPRARSAKLRTIEKVSTVKTN